jgi:hypothetical protein
MVVFPCDSVTLVMGGLKRQRAVLKFDGYPDFQSGLKVSSVRGESVK